jgi:hypothetical protein
VATGVLTALAFIIPLAIFLLLKPKKSSRQGQIQSALLLLLASVNFGAAVNSYSEGRSPVLPLILGAIAVAGAVFLLMRNRRYTPS